MTLPHLILASGSEARIAMLKNAGLEFTAIPAAIDEKEIAERLKRKKTPPGKIASALAREKALYVARVYPGALVIGADQVLAQGKNILSKARDRGDAVKTLKALKGKTHFLISAVCVAEGEKILWSHADKARVTMRKFSGRLLENYCAKAGLALTRSVGACELEGLGAWLVERAQGDFFTILGMPLLPLLGYLSTKRGFTP